MIEYTDAFGRQTFIEVIPSPWNKRASIAIRKERQTLYESLTLEDLKKLSTFIKATITNLEENNVKEI